MIETYYTALADLFENNIKHYYTSEKIRVIVAGEEKTPDEDQNLMPSIVIYRQIDMDIWNSHPNYRPFDYWEEIQDENGDFVRIVKRKPEIPVRLMSRAELWTLNSLEDINFTKSIIKLFGRRRFSLTLDISADRKVEIYTDVSNVLDLSTKGMPRYGKELMGGYIPDFTCFRKVWNLQTMVHLLESDEAPEIGTPVDEYQQSIDDKESGTNYENEDHQIDSQYS